MNIILWILSSRIFRIIVNPRYKKVLKTESGNLCIILSKTNRLGDLVIHNFIVQQLQRYNYTISYGMSNSFFKTHKVFLENHSLTKNFFVLPEKKQKWIQFILSIRRKKINAVLLDAQPLISSLFFYLAGVPVILSPKGTTSGFFTKEYYLDKSNLHYTDLVNSILHLLDYGKKEKRAHRIGPFFPFKAADVVRLKDTREVLLSVHIGGSNHWNRKWPSEKYNELCALFLTHYTGKVFLIGGKEEYGLNEDIKQMLIANCDAEGRVVNFCGTDLNTIANVIASSHVFVGNDSGPMHIANALNKRVIVIFGPSPIAALNPTKYDKRNVTVYADLECVPCGSQTCKLPDDKKHSCLTGLSTEIVWDKLQRVIQMVHPSVTSESISK